MIFDADVSVISIHRDEMTDKSIIPIRDQRNLSTTEKNMNQWYHKNDINAS